LGGLEMADKKYCGGIALFLMQRKAKSKEEKSMCRVSKREVIV